jgi:hypothetical protein
MKTIDDIVREGLDRWRAFGGLLIYGNSKEHIARAAIAACAEDVRKWTPTSDAPTRVLIEGIATRLEGAIAEPATDRGASADPRDWPGGVPTNPRAYFEARPLTEAEIAEHFKVTNGTPACELAAYRCAFCPGEIPRALCPPIGTFAICAACAEWLHANSRPAGMKTIAEGPDLRVALAQAGSILEALNASVRWELAPEVKAAIKDALETYVRPALGAALEGAAAGEPAPDSEDRPATREEISRALQRTHEAFERGPIGSPEYLAALAEQEEIVDAPACESCSKPADGRTLDDVPLCSECGKALEAEVRVDPKVLIAARNYLVEHRNDEFGPVLLIKDLYDAVMNLGGENKP